MRGWSIFFWVAAAFNVLIGAVLMLAPERYAPGAEAALLLPVRCMGLFIAVFGVGYAMVANAPAQHAGIVKLGVIGKLSFVTLMLVAFSSGIVRMDQLATSLLDLPWAAAFIVFLTRTARQA